MAGLKNYPFEGYAFIGEPPNQSRLWFLEKELWGLIVYGQYTVLRNTKFVGRWSRTCQYIGGEDGKLIAVEMTETGLPVDAINRAVANSVIRWEPWDGGEPLVWRTTDTTIGERPAMWRLGLWPD